ncbi:MAG: ATP-binding cassette domain-containing protein [Bifidobacteriaceae bacterium]|nr:ATP-binding cassette domain-containing protein [Bifidobacteriaceae bacterium]
MTTLTFEDVTVRYGRFKAVRAVNLSVAHGETVGLVGESGSGKTTLARAAVGLAPLAGGRVLLDGQPPTPRRGPHQIQLVFQDPYSSLDPRMRVGNAIAEALPADADRTQATARLLELVRLPAAAARAHPAALSGGERQRVAIARALGARPDVLIADEITSALDVSTQGAILNLVRELQRELGLTMLFISHNLAVVRYVAGRVAVMKDGRLVEEGPASEVLTQPRDPYTTQLLAAVPRRRHNWNGES